MTDLNLRVHKALGYIILSEEEMRKEAESVWSYQPSCISFMKGFNAWRDSDGVHTEQQTPNYCGDMTTAWKLIDAVKKWRFHERLWFTAELQNVTSTRVGDVLVDYSFLHFFLTPEDICVAFVNTVNRRDND